MIRKQKSMIYTVYECSILCVNWVLILSKSIVRFSLFTHKERVDWKVAKMLIILLKFILLLHSREHCLSFCPLLASIGLKCVYLGSPQSVGHWSATDGHMLYINRHKVVFGIQYKGYSDTQTLGTEIRPKVLLLCSFWGKPTIPKPSYGLCSLSLETVVNYNYKRFVETSFLFVKINRLNSLIPG